VSVRLGVLSDLHCELDPTGSRWINVFEPERLDERLDEALGWFGEAEVDLVLLLGDVIQFANLPDAEHALARVAAAAVAPVATVGGNHDLRLGDDFAACARASGIRLLHAEPLLLEGVALTGVGVGRGAAPPQYVGALAAADADAPFVVVASHFPLLSEAGRLAAVGLPYPGDLVNRAALETQLADDRRPAVGLSGHIHARTSAMAGGLLQLTVGALIEPPFDATIVEIDGGTVARTARRLGPLAETDPVFTADDERWRWVGDQWEAV
jgi:hypothetical protein